MSFTAWKTQFSAYEKQFSELSTREKVLILLSTIVGIGYIGFTFFIEPHLTDLSQSKLELTQLNTELSQLESSAREYKKALQVDINLPLKQQISGLEKKLSFAEQEINQISDQLVQAQQMSQMLEAMLSQTHSLKLLKLQSLPAVNLLAKPNKNDFIEPNNQLPKTELAVSKSSIGLYQQGILLTIEGNYHDIHQFLQQAEQLPWRFYWQQFNYQVGQYPTAQLELKLITLSLSKGFVSL